MIIPAVVFFALDLKYIYEKSQEYENLVYLEANPNLKLWNDLERIIRQLVPNFASEMVAYIKWTYTETQKVQWDVGSRPPVGRYAPSFKKTRSAPGGSKEQRGGGGRPPNRNQNRGGGSQNQRPSQSNRSEYQKGPNREKQALHLVENAVKELKSDPQLGEVKLPPANSFYRRLQHKHVMTLGFYSESYGDGNDRAVVIMRNKPEQEENP